MSAIISIDDLTDYKNTDLTPGVAQQVVDAVNTFISSTTKRCWGETTTLTERYDWNRVIYLRHQDVTSVTSVKLGYPGQTQTTLASGSYFVNNFGRLTFFAPFHGQGALAGGNVAYSDWLEITYQYGVIDVPDDLKLAALGVASGFYNWAKNGQKDIVASQVGSYRVEYSGAIRSTIRNPSMNTAEANWDIIASYATRRA